METSKFIPQIQFTRPAGMLLVSINVSSSKRQPSSLPKTQVIYFMRTFVSTGVHAV